MSGTLLIVLVVGAWLVALGTVGVCASIVKDVDREQSTLFLVTRRDRFLAPPRHVRIVDARVRRRRPQLPKSYVGG